MTLAEKVSRLEKRVFRGIQTQPAGQAYASLCRSFPTEEIKTEAHHARALKVVERLIDFLGGSDCSEDVREDTSRYLAALSSSVERFEVNRFPTGKVKGIEVLEYLMQAHGLCQSDLKDDLGGQSIVSLILSGKRDLNLRQIRALAKRFKVSPGVFIGG